MEPKKLDLRRTSYRLNELPFISELELCLRLWRIYVIFVVVMYTKMFKDVPDKLLKLSSLDIKPRRLTNVRQAFTEVRIDSQVDGQSVTERRTGTSYITQTGSPT